MFSLELRCPPDERDLLLAELWEQGSAGIVELSESRLRAFFEDAADRHALLARFDMFDPVPRAEEERDWVAYSRENWQPILAGSRFFLVPEWRDDPAPPGRFRIAVNPGLAFGTGVHETTQLSIEALERHVQPGMTVVDVGTGSGILSQVAELLGAARVIACDNDPLAIEVARTNLRTALLFAGSADAIEANTADLLVANINPEALAAMAPELARVLRPNGTALLSGLEGDDATEIRTAVRGTLKAEHRKGDWWLLEYSL
jgi:ribosomal protein L11 methyltransferase